MSNDDVNNFTKQKFLEAERDQRKQEEERILESLKKQRQQEIKRLELLEKRDKEAAERYKKTNPTRDREGDLAAAEYLMEKDRLAKTSPEAIARADTAAEAWAQEIDNSKATPKLKPLDSREINLDDIFSPPKTKSPTSKKINLDNLFVNDGFNPPTAETQNDLGDFSSSIVAQKKQKTSPIPFEEALEDKVKNAIDASDQFLTDLEIQAQKEGIITPKSSKLGKLANLSSQALKKAKSFGAKILSSPKQKNNPISSKSQEQGKNSSKNLNRQNSTVKNKGWDIGQ